MDTTAIRLRHIETLLDEMQLELGLDFGVARDDDESISQFADRIVDAINDQTSSLHDAMARVEALGSEAADLELDIDETRDDLSEETADDQ